MSETVMIQVGKGELKKLSELLAQTRPEPAAPPRTVFLLPVMDYHEHSLVVQCLEAAVTASRSIDQVREILAVADKIKNCRREDGFEEHLNTPEKRVGRAHRPRKKATEILAVSDAVMCGCEKPASHPGLCWYRRKNDKKLNGNGKKRGRGRRGQVDEALAGPEAEDLEA
jgi:hypothetical protein